MWVVSLKRLRQFWAVHPRAEVPLRGWFTQTSAAEWQNFADLRATFPSADRVGNGTVFNIGGNNYRLIVRVFFSSHKVYVLRIMTHVQYDREDWAEQCGCHEPPPARTRPIRRNPRVKRSPTRRKKQS
jgi:mRNA interferase HigB